MARLFSIEIPFENKRHTALVSMRENGYDICCQVRFVDKSLRYLIPGDQFVFSLQEGLVEPKDLPDELSKNLVACTINVLAEHFAIKH